MAPLGGRMRWLISSWRCGALALGIAAVGCSSDEPEAPGGPGSGQCEIPLTYGEIRTRCTEGLKKCLDAPPQSTPGGLFGHSSCYDCQDECMRLRGRWPSKVRGKPCL